MNLITFEKNVHSESRYYFPATYKKTSDIVTLYLPMLKDITNESSELINKYYDEFTFVYDEYYNVITTNYSMICVDIIVISTNKKGFDDVGI